MLIGIDPKNVFEFTKACREVTNKPFLAKLTPNVDDITEHVMAAKRAGATGVSLINTEGPHKVYDGYGNPILTSPGGGGISYGGSHH